MQKIEREGRKMLEKKGGTKYIKKTGFGLSSDFDGEGNYVEGMQGEAFDYRGGGNGAGSGRGGVGGGWI